jgi:hypothetical protein
MSRSVVAASLLALTLAFGTGSAWAQSSSPAEFGKAGPVSFGLGAGVSVPVSNASDVFKNGWVGHGFVRLNETGLPMNIRMDFTFHSFDLDEAQVGMPGTQSIFAGLGDLEFELLHSGMIRPYIIAGIGAYFINMETKGPLGGNTSDTSMGINGGAGVRIRLGGTLLGYMEARVDNIYSDQGVINPDNIQLVPVTFGVVF